MTLEKYAKILDRVIMCEAGWVCADRSNVYVFIKKPVFVENSRGIPHWEGAGGNYPILITRYKEGDLDLDEYKDEDGEIDWSACKVRI